MEEKKYKEVPVEEAIKQLDELFNIKNFEKTEGESYRVDVYEYHIHTSEMKMVDILTKLFEFFNGRIVMDGEKDMLCEITYPKPEDEASKEKIDYVIFKLV